MAFSKHRGGIDDKDRRPSYTMHLPRNNAALDDIKTRDFVVTSTKLAKLGVKKEELGNQLIQKGRAMGHAEGRMLQKRGQEWVREGQAEYNYHIGRARQGNKLIRARHKRG